MVRSAAMRWLPLSIALTGCQVVGTGAGNVFATGGSASGTSSGTSSGSSGGTSSGSSDLGGCSPQSYFEGSVELTGGEFAVSSCACGMSLTADSSPYLQAWATNGTGSACETVCSTSANCPDPRTSCQSGSCKLNGCVTYLTACDATGSGTADGECLEFDGIGGALGLCTLGGAAGLGQPCSFFATRQNPDTLCNSGLVCVPADDVSCTLNDGAGICQTACTLVGQCSTGPCQSTNPGGCFAESAPFYCPDGGS
jgi:hypothetical protein